MNDWPGCDAGRRGESTTEMAQAFLGFVLGFGMVGLFMVLLPLMAALEEASTKRAPLRNSNPERMTNTASEPAPRTTVLQEPGAEAAEPVEPARAA